MNYYSGMTPMVQTGYGPVYSQQYGGYYTPSPLPATTAQQIIAHQQSMMQQPQPIVQQPVVQQPVVQQPVQNNSQFNGVVVNDFEDVKGYPVPIGGLTLLLNKKDKKFYIKSLNENGVPVIETYNFDVANGVTVDTVDSKETNQLDTIIKRLDALETKLRVE